MTVGRTRSLGVVAVGVLALAPWLVWLVGDRGVLPIIAGSLAIAMSWHGWGRIVGALADRRDARTALAIGWGVAATIAVSGTLLALGVYDPRPIVVAGAAAHTASVVLARAAIANDAADALTWRRMRYWLVPVAAITAIALVRIVAAAGDAHFHPFDDDGHIAAQIERAVTTGGLADPIGYPRIDQLGGEIAIPALTSAFELGRSLRWVDSGIALAVLLVVIGCAIGSRDARSAIWTSIVAIVVAVLAVPTFEPALTWTPALLIIGAALTLDDAHGRGWNAARELVPLAIVAGALAALRAAYMPCAFAFIAIAVWRLAAAGRLRGRDVLILALAFAAVLVGFVVARHGAWSTVAPAARAFASVSGGGFALLALFAVLALIAVPLALAAAPGQDVAASRWTLVACALALAGIASSLVGARAVAAHAVWPIGLGAAMTIAVAVGKRAQLGGLTFAFVTLALVGFYDGHEASGRMSAPWRYYDLMNDALAARFPRVPSLGYDELFAHVPIGETVAIYVDRPDRVDYARNRVFDLRTPRFAALRATGEPATTATRLERLIAATGARWLVVEDDDVATMRASASVIIRMLCSPDRPRTGPCSDALEQLTTRLAPIATVGHAHLYALR